MIEKRDVLSDLLAGKVVNFCEECKNYLYKNDPLNMYGAGKCLLDDSFVFAHYVCDNFNLIEVKEQSKK